MKGRAILVTGLSGVGKSHYAKSLGFSTIHYDQIHDYATDKTDYKHIRGFTAAHKKDKEIVIDAWGFHFDPDLSILQKLLGGREIEIRFFYMTPLQLHLSQLQKERVGQIKLQKHQAGFINHTTQLQKGMEDFAISILTPLQSKGVNVEWVYREGNQIIKYENNSHFLDTITKDPTTELLEWIDKTSGDGQYQTIEVDDSVIRSGYMQSKKLWQQIENLGINWKGKTIADLGCFNGYFSFKAEQAGAKVVDSYDNNAAAIKICERIKLLNKSKCVFNQRDLSTNLPTKTCDIVLLLGCFHHITNKMEHDRVGFMKNIFDLCKALVITANPEHLNSIIYPLDFVLKKRTDTRPQTDQGPRQLLYYERKA